MNCAPKPYSRDHRRTGQGPARALAALLAALVLAVLLPASGAAAAEDSPGWRIQVRNAACVTGSIVLLGEIADVRGSMPAEQWKILAAKPLWPSPEKAGHQTALSRERLLAMLRHYVGQEAEAYVLPQQIVVQRGGRAVDGAALERLAVAFLTERGAGLRGDMEITDLRMPEYVFLPNPGDRLNLQMSGAVLPGRNNLLLEIVSGAGKATRRFAGSCFVNLWRAVACATKPLNRLELVTPDMVTFKRKNMAYQQKAWDGSGGPWRVARSVGTDQVITLDSIEPVPVIARGNKINLVFESPSIRLSVKAEALADAGIGQRIQVRNMQSNRKISGTVQDAETVVVR